MVRLRTLKHQQQLFAKGAPPEGMFAVIRGHIRITSTTAGGREALLTLHRAGDWFGESSVFDGQPRGFSASAHGECLLLMIPISKFNALLDSQPSLYKHFIPWLCQRIRLSTLLLESKALLKLEGQLAHRLLLLANASSADGSSEPNDLRLSQEDLSYMLGTSRQSINKLLSAWECKGWIKRRYGGIRILDSNSLEELTV